MNRDELIKELILWHDNDEHEKIIAAIEELPKREWDFEISGLYARALNNMERYEEALDQLFMFQDEGKENGVWNFRVGYSLYCLNRKAEAVQYFQWAIDFGDDAEDTHEMLRWSILARDAKPLPEIKSTELENAKENAGDYLAVFLDIYLELMSVKPEIFQEFNTSQHTLLAFYYFHSQVCNGGFIQLIQNGYGAYIFDNPFSECIHYFGAEETAKIIEEAKPIYQKHKEKLEAETTEEEFAQLYKDIKEFEPLERSYLEINKTEAEKVKQYVEKHIEEFGMIIEEKNG